MHYRYEILFFMHYRHEILSIVYIDLKFFRTWGIIDIIVYPSISMGEDVQPIYMDLASESDDPHVTVIDSLCLACHKMVCIGEM